MRLSANARQSTKATARSCRITKQNSNELQAAIAKESDKVAALKDPKLGDHIQHTKDDLTNIRNRIGRAAAHSANVKRRLKE